MAAAPELIPEGVTVVEALPAIGMLAAFLFVVGCIYVVDGFVRALFGTVSGAVGWIPWAGKVLSSPVHKIEQKLTSALGSAESYFDSHIGMSLHKLARIGDHLGRELYGLALLTLTLAKVLTGQVTPQDLARLWHDLRAAGAGAEHAVEHALGRVGGLEHVVAKEVEGLVIPWEHTIQHELDHVFTPELRALRERAKSLEDSALDTFRWIRAHPLSLATGAFVGAIAYAIGRLGMGWTRCAANRGLGRFICGLGPQLFESLLSDAFEALIVLDLCEMIALMSAAARDFEPVLIGFVDVEDALIGCHGATRPAALALPALQLPPSPGALALA